MLVRDKHSSSLRKSVNYGRNKFYDIGPWTPLHSTLRVLSANIKIGLKWLRETNALAYNTTVLITCVKSFMALTTDHHQHILELLKLTDPT